MKINVHNLPKSVEPNEAKNVIELFNVYGWEPIFCNHQNGHAKFTNQVSIIEIWFSTLTVKETVDGIDIFDKHSNLERIERIINSYE